MTLEIDLKNLSDERAILEILGAALGYTDDKIWGKNMDAFNDILGYLEQGGIWGNNKIIHYPLALRISNFQNFRNHVPGRFTILNEILESHKDRYAKENKIFEFNFIE